MKRVDAIVVGGGVCGLGAGYFLSESMKVVVLERESQPAYHSSGRSAALYIIGYESPEVSVLTAAGQQFYNNPPEGFDDGPLIKPRGGLTLTEPGMEPRMTSFLDRWHTHCPRLSRITLEEALERVPLLRPEQLAAAAFDPDWYSIDVHRLVMGYRRGILRRGSLLQCSAEVTSVERQGTVWRVAAGDVFEAPLLINAAGAWAAQIGQMAGLGGVPLQPLRRTAVLLPLPEGAGSWPSVNTLADDLYFKPEGNGLMLSPEDETPTEPCDAAPEEIDVARGIDHFERVTTKPVNKILSKWAGLRTFSPDRRPVIGRDPREPSFCWYAGLGGFGVQTSPGLGRLIADCVLGSKQPSSAIDVSRYAGAMQG
ncbi:MAG: FAD-binding oxidoreductase [Gammaproteobacteria bacterium]|nr:FAD-binding oxidoreductase [Gammaproteobacteria bacterium]